MESERRDRQKYGGGIVTRITVYDNGNDIRDVFTRVISANLTRTLSGECTFEFSVTTAMSEQIHTGFQVLLESEDLLYRFRIVRVSKSISGGITICKISCEHISCLLNDSEYDVETFEFEGSPSDCLKQLLENTPLEAGECEPGAPAQLKINRKCTRRAALMQLVGLCGGEIDYSDNAVCIREHLGSEEYREIMDGKNITDLSVDIDSRADTFSYGIKFYKKMNFSIGDNVHIVFSPFFLDVRTRIISMSLNPFNRREISIEVGDYVPSIADNLYRLQNETSNTQHSVSESTAQIKTAINNTDLSVSDKTTEIFRLSFNAIKSTYAAFISTVNFTVKKGGTIHFILKKDENEVIRYTEQFENQDYARTYSYPFVSEPGINVITLSAQSPDGSAVLPKMKSWGYVMGAYLAGDNPWDGYIRIVQPVPEFRHTNKWRKYHETLTERETLTIPYRHEIAVNLRNQNFLKTAEWRKSHAAIRDILPMAWSTLITAPPPLKAENISDTEVRIEMRNPVTAAGIIDAEAFSMIVTVGEDTTTVTAVSVMLDKLTEIPENAFGSVLTLTFAENTMKNSTQSITVIYDSEKGNLLDVWKSAPCESFQTSFIYEKQEE